MAMRAWMAAAVAVLAMGACGFNEASDRATDSGDRPPAQTERAEGGCRVPDDVERVTDLNRSGDVDCETAVAVAQAYDAEVMGGGEFPDAEPVPAAGFSCRASQEGAPSEETSQVACTDRAGGVSFRWGV